MKRFHVNVAVADLGRSIKFYSILFGQSPTVLKNDYAKWLLEDPRLNFSLSESEHRSGVNHIGLQAETDDELASIRKRLHWAGQETFEQVNAECCYAKSSKTWVRDPDDVAWETFVTHEDLPHYGGNTMTGNGAADGKAGRCCATESVAGCCETAAG
jgi:catechol 2,3-dioxygenase-like lactoylglutathione lyase family enzyme